MRDRVDFAGFSSRGRLLRIPLHLPCIDHQVRQQVAAKTEARAELMQEYGSDSFSHKDMERVLDSIADANNYIAFNVAPVER